MKRTVYVSKETMNAMLPSIPPDFERQMLDMAQAMPADRKDTPVKKRISVGLILALMITLLTVGALAAAFLGGKDFVDQIVAPKAAENAEKKFTQAEVQEILRIARENNLELDEHTEQRLLQMEEGYYKDELMRLFVKTEYGSQPGAWPIEVQRWYEEMVHACGLANGDHIENVLPEAGEISQEEALEIALDYIKANYEPDPKVSDESLYARYLSFRETVVNPYLTTRCWNLYYTARDLYHADYMLVITNHGEVTDARMYESVLANPETPDSVGSRLYRKYANEYGLMNYTTDIMLEYQDLLGQFVAQVGDGRLSTAEKHLLNQTFVLPDETLLTARQAIQRVKQACGGEKRPWANPYQNGETALCMLAGDKPVWRITLDVYDTPQKIHWSVIYAQVDAKTGDILYLDDSLSTLVENGGAWRGWVTEEYWMDHKPIPQAPYAPAFTPRPDGQPALWGNTDVAPQWFWDRLDAEGVNNENAGWWLTQLEEAYGLEDRWWPLEAQAICEIRWELTDDAYSASRLPIHGLPADTDIPRAQAEEIARAAFMDAYGEALGKPAEAWLLAARFYFRSPAPETNSWAFEVVDPDTYGLVACVSLNAETGEINGLALADAESLLPFVEDRPLATPAPQADGAPWMWGMDFAPASFWQQMQETMAENGVTFDNIGEKVQEWDALYGGEEAYGLFWPQDFLVMRDVLCDLTDPAEPFFSYAAFPKPDGITQEQALSIGWDAFLPLCENLEGEAARIVTEDWIQSLRPSAHLWRYTQEGPTYQLAPGAYWLVQMMRWENGAYQTRGYLILSEDGEVLYAELVLLSNG